MGDASPEDDEGKELRDRISEMLTAFYAEKWAFVVYSDSCKNSYSEKRLTTVKGQKYSKRWIRLGSVLDSSG